VSRKQIAIILAAVILLFGIKVSSARAADWFVRPWDTTGAATYGAGNGTNYNNAWAGLNNIQWGEVGVRAGDTLWICGVHGDRPGAPYSYESLYSATSLAVGASGTSENPITIRGDCLTSNQDYENGTVYRTSRRYGTGWIDTGTNGVYTHDSYSAVGQMYEDRQQMHRTQMTCSDQPTSEELFSFSLGDWCYVKATNKIYLKPLSGIPDPNNHVYLNVYGMGSIWIENHDYVIVKNLKEIGGSMYVYNSKYITADHIELSDAYYGVQIHAGSHNFTLKNSKLDMVGNGVYFIYGQGDSNNGLIEHNSITNVDNLGQAAGAPDAHGVGIQGGINNVVRYNYFNNVSTAVTGYLGKGWPEMSLEMYGNYAENIWRWPTTTAYADGNSPNSGHGCAFDYHGPSTGNVNILIHNNIAKNVENAGVRAAGANAKIYNNIIIHANIGIYVNNASVPAREIAVKNNIVFNPYDYGRGLPTVFAYLYSDMTASISPPIFDVDHNLYYSSVGTSNKFYFSRAQGYAVPTISYAEWRSKLNSMEGNSFIAVNPQFTNPSGSFSQPTDFKIAAGSPAIDAGANVGLTADFEGTAVPQGSAPDIGAFEYKAAAPTYSSADINQDNSIDSLDLYILKTDFLKLTANLTNPRSDINADGQCTARDLGILMSEWKN
jgi:hypothetical protein